MTARPNHLPAASTCTPGLRTASRRRPGIPIRYPWLALCLALLAILSTLAGFQVARFHDVWAKWLSARPVQTASSIQPLPSLVSDSKPAATGVELERLSRLAPQQQAEPLLDLAIHRDERSLDMIRQRQDAWRGRLESTDRLFHLVLAALDSEDPRVRAAAVEIDLAASNPSNSRQSVTHLLNQINNDPGSRSLTLWRLGALGNRGVEPAIVLATLLRYAHDSSQQTRFWAVEGLEIGRASCRE